MHRGEVSPQQATEAAIERIESLNPKLNAVVERAFDAARSRRQALITLALGRGAVLAKDMNIEVAGCI